MKGDRIPDTDHIARQCGGATIHEDGTIDGAAFRLRNLRGGWEEYLSVNWLESLDPTDREHQLELLRKVFVDKGRKLAARSKFAVHEVDSLRELVRRETADRRDLTVLHEHFPDDASHCGIFGLEHDDDVVADLMAEAVREVYPARG